MKIVVPESAYLWGGVAFTFLVVAYSTFVVWAHVPMQLTAIDLEKPGRCLRFRRTVHPLPRVTLLAVSAWSDMAFCFAMTKSSLSTPIVAWAAAAVMVLSAIVGFAVASALIMRPLRTKDDKTINTGLVASRIPIFAVLILASAVVTPELLIVVPWASSSFHGFPTKRAMLLGHCGFFVRTLPLLGLEVARIGAGGWDPVLNQAAYYALCFGTLKTLFSSVKLALHSVSDGKPSKGGRKASREPQPVHVSQYFTSMLPVPKPLSGKRTNTDEKEVLNPVLLNKAKAECSRGKRGGGGAGLSEASQQRAGIARLGFTMKGQQLTKSAKEGKVLDRFFKKESIGRVEEVKADSPATMRKRSKDAESRLQADVRMMREGEVVRKEAALKVSGARRASALSTASSPVSSAELPAVGGGSSSALFRRAASQGWGLLRKGFGPKPPEAPAGASDERPSGRKMSSQI